MTALWTVDEIIAAVNGDLLSAHHNGDINGVAFDSREILAGDLFIAMKGEASDGHLFVNAAVKNGAAAILISDDVSFDGVCNVIKVEDTQEALNNLGIAARRRMSGKVIGVTGSAGKTGTKEALFAALNRISFGKAHRSVKSYNNHVGVPLSLARMPRDCEYAVFEMGMNHVGELSALTKLVQPNAAIITTIAPAHIEFFKDESEIARAKAEIFEGLTKGGQAIISYDSPYFDLMAGIAASLGHDVIGFGFNEGADICAIEMMNRVEGGSHITAAFAQKLGGGQVTYQLSQDGRHWASNSLAVMGAVHAVGGDLAVAGLALADMAGLQGRGEVIVRNVGGGSATMIDESYNANPASMKATIEQASLTFSKPQNGHSQLILILGSMKELGDQSDHYHAALAPIIMQANPHHVILVGDEMKNLFTSMKSQVEPNSNIHHCRDAEHGEQLFHQLLCAGDLILVKGSNSVGLSKIVNKFKGLGT
ncbi:hypothetical protein LPB140_09440 [Sphingorhabdus lutea]|uniref:UDP-N-acetylmuramoyl-tripeptide--D-alanyl-D-alanine ligase n=1 Tax=Sphingorhabdus lutea TaxID=1913578 RepID=A0A1L3JCW6_9SPHN|nr:UDP-N-acetylmuramoyl-tripeptide--D-alanyl-D-alanine ligase [Sphingorhabdus lutea]APG62975.1 hypothetical protein LPB140_09440 [Sphingorhabdus lutea]